MVNWSILNRIVHSSCFWIILVPLHLTQLSLDLSRLLHLLFQSGSALSQLTRQVFDLTIFVFFDEGQFVLRRLHLPLQFCLCLFPLRCLWLEVLNFILKVIHVNLHLMLKLYKTIVKELRSSISTTIGLNVAYFDMSSDIWFQFLNQLFIFCRWTAHVVQIIDIVVAWPGTFLGLHHRTYRILHALLNQIIGGNGQRGETAINAILFKPVPIVKLFLQVLNLQIHNYLDRCSHIL